MANETRLTDKDLKEIREKLENKAAYKRDIALAKAQKEVEVVNREYDAYWDGVYDAIKAVSALIPADGERSNDVSGTDKNH